MAFYFHNHIKHMTALCGQNTELLTVEAGGMYRYQCGLQVESAHCIRPASKQVCWCTWCPPNSFYTHTRNSEERIIKKII
jgi:hypothetical protein